MRMGLYRTYVPSYRYKNILKRIYVFTIFILTLIMFYMFFSRLKMSFINAFKPYAVNIGSDAINFTVADYFNENNFTYSDFSNITYSNNSEITSVQMNTALINKMKSELSIRLQDEILKHKTNTVSLHLGNLCSNIIFHGYGPQIKVKVTPQDISDLLFYDVFESVGINQVRHKIYIEAYVTVSVSCATMVTSEVIQDIIPVAETIIVGEVPKYYSTSEKLPVNIEPEE